MVEALGIVSAAIGTLGMLGNFVVSLVIWRVPHMHTVTNAFLLNQAVTDLLGSFVFVLIFNIPEASTLPAGVSGWLYCYLWKSECVMWMFLMTSAFSLVMVTLERYLAIVYPFKYEALMAWRRVPALAIAMTWAAGFLTALGILALVVYSDQDNRCDVALPTPSEHHFNIIVQVCNFITFVIPALTMLFAYIHIAVTLRRGARQTQPAPVTPSCMTDATESDVNKPLPETQEDSLRRACRNVIRTLVLVCLAYFICWLPHTVMMGANVVGLPYRIATVFAATNSCINPLIYTIKYKSFRRGLRILISRNCFPAVHHIHH